MILMEATFLEKKTNTKHLKRNKNIKQTNETDSKRIYEMK